MLGCSCFFFSSRRRHTRGGRDWSSDVCSSDLLARSIDDGDQDDERRQRSIEPIRQVVDRRYPDGQQAGAQNEIGRGSCRGRGEISVVAVSLKKKKKEAREGGATLAQADGHCGT